VSSSVSAGVESLVDCDGPSNDVIKVVEESIDRKERIAALEQRVTELVLEAEVGERAADVAQATVSWQCDSTTNGDVVRTGVELIRYLCIGSAACADCGDNRRGG